MVGQFFKEFGLSSKVTWPRLRLGMDTRIGMSE